MESSGAVRLGTVKEIKIARCDKVSTGSLIMIFTEWREALRLLFAPGTGCSRRLLRLRHPR